MSNGLDLDLVIDGDDLGVLGDSNMASLDGVLDWVLGVEDLVEFLELSSRLANVIVSMWDCVDDLQCAFWFLGRRNRQGHPGQRSKPRR